MKTLHSLPFIILTTLGTAAVAPAQGTGAPRSNPSLSAEDVHAQNSGNGIVVSNGMVFLLRNGQATQIQQPMNLRIAPNGAATGFDGQPFTIPNGQMLTLDGRLAPIPQNIAGLPGSPGAAATTGLPSSTGSAATTSNGTVNAPANAAPMATPALGRQTIATPNATPARAGNVASPLTAPESIPNTTITHVPAGNASQPHTPGVPAASPGSATKPTAPQRNTDHQTPAR